MRLPLAIGAALAAAALIAPPALAAPEPARGGEPPAGGKVDVIVLPNGTRVVGAIKSLHNGRLEFSTDDMGTLQIEWSKVVQITAPGFFEVEDLGGALYFGSLRPARAERGLEVSSDRGANSLQIARVGRIELVKSGFWRRFRGSIDLGASYTSASQLFQLQGDGTSITGRRSSRRGPRPTPSSRTSRTWKTPGELLAIGYARLFADRQRLYTQATLEQNRELGFDLRSTVLGGCGYMLARDARNELVGGGGIAVNRENAV